MKTLAAIVLFVGVAFSQDAASAAHLRESSKAAIEKMPSDAELTELFDKARQKVAAFRIAVDSVKPQLDSIDVHLAPGYLDAASTADAIISKLKEKGASGAGLLMLITTMDDLALDATQGGLRLLAQSQGHNGDEAKTAMSVMSLSTAEVGCYDISELLVHATLRFVGAEDSLLNEITAQLPLPPAAAH